MKRNLLISGFAGVVLALSLRSCAHPRMIPPVSWDIMTLHQGGCICEKLAPEQQEHMLLIGDALMAEWVRAINECPDLVPTPTPKPTKTPLVVKVE